MPNMPRNKNPMPEQEPSIRNKNFKEVALGYTEQMAVEEAQRCFGCKSKPCVAECPVGVRIPEFIGKTALGEFESAYEILKSTNSLPAICGRVCPQESQCESKCVRGIKGEPVAIGRLERFVADYNMVNCVNEITVNKTNGNSVAIIGSGPAGLSCAGELAKMGYDVTIFEASHVEGGVLVYGIPEFRLPKKIVEKEVDDLKKQGVKIMKNMVIGKVLDIDEIFEMGFKAVFIASGAGLPNFMNMPGEGFIGVYSANEYLTRINLMKSYKTGYDTPILGSKAVAVVGGGNVAMDAVRSAKRLGAEKAFIVYRRSENEMGARLEEIHHAKEEGIDFRVLTNPIRVIGDENNRVTGLECVQMELGEPDASGRRRPIEIESSKFTLDVDTVIIAIGTSPNPMITSTTKGLETNKYGCIVADDNMKTSRVGVYAGGDVVTGAATVIMAMGAGKTAAKSIDEYIKSV